MPFVFVSDINQRGGPGIWMGEYWSVLVSTGQSLFLCIMDRLAKPYCPQGSEKDPVFGVHRGQ